MSDVSVVRKSGLFTKDFFSSIARKPSKTNLDRPTSLYDGQFREPSRQSEPRRKKSSPGSLHSRRSTRKLRQSTSTPGIVSTSTSCLSDYNDSKLYATDSITTIISEVDNETKLPASQPTCSTNHPQLGSPTSITEPRAMQLANNQKSPGSPSPGSPNLFGGGEGGGGKGGDFNNNSQYHSSTSILGSGTLMAVNRPKEPHPVVMADAVDPLTSGGDSSPISHGSPSAVVTDYCKYFDVDSFDHSKLDLNSYDHSSIPTSNTSQSSTDFDSNSCSATSAASSLNTSVCLPSDSLCVRQFKGLEQDLAKFKVKHGRPRSNTLRLSLLSFLRTEPVFSPFELTLKLNVMGKWWSSLLEDLVNKTVSVSDRSAYLEGIAGLMARPEWALYDKSKGSQQAQADNGSFFATPYQVLLYQTLSFVMTKLSMKTVPVSVAAFSGKVLAYNFFYAPGVAECLLHILAVPQADIDRICKLCLSDSDSSDSDELVADAELMRHFVPNHVAHLVKYRKGRKSTFPRHMLRNNCPPIPCCPLLDGMYGPWTRRWASSSSDVFYAFLKHYYCIAASVLSTEIASKWQQVILFPGMLVVHGFILGSLDYAIRCRQNSSPSPLGVGATFNSCRGSPPPPKIQRTFSTAPVDAIAAFPALPPPQRQKFEQLKVLSCIRTVLHSDQVCSPLYVSYIRLFESILQSTALRVNVFDAECCLNFADLVEEFLGSLLCEALSKRPQAPLDWGFWICVAQRMMCSYNVQTELRSIAMIYNLWDNLTEFDGHSLVNQAYNSYLDSKPEEVTSSSESPLDTLTRWILSPEIWSKYFGHWQPLIRAYFHRLLCWRVAIRSPDLLAKRLVQSYQHVEQVIEKYNTLKKEGPLLNPAPPVVGRKLDIIMRPPNHERASNGVFSRIHPYDVFDDYVYSSSSFMPEDTSSTLQSSSSSIKSSVSRASSSSKTKNALFGLKRYFTSAVTGGGSAASSEKRKIMVPPKASRFVAPDIDRPLHRFCLDFCPQSASRPIEVIMSKRGAGAPVIDTKILALPTLPATDFNEFGGVVLDPGTDILAQAENVPTDEAGSLKGMTPYEGRSLAEWNKAVCQFNEYCRSQRLMAGAQHFEDIEVPYLAIDLARNFR